MQKGYKFDMCICMTVKAYRTLQLVLENASNFRGFLAIKFTFSKKILNYVFQVRDGVTRKTLHIVIIFNEYKKGVNNYIPLSQNFQNF